MSKYDTTKGLFEQIDTNRDGAIDKGEFRKWLSNTEALTDDTVIHTHSLEETNEYLERSGHNCYRDPNPQIIRRAATDGPISCEQRVAVRYLQPPPVPESGPLIIREVRPAQPPPPQPLVIRQHASTVSSLPPPLILRERPPTQPTSTCSETVNRYLPEIPVPPRSVVIERLPCLPERPRDIIIERWLPYRSLGQRRTIVERAGPPIVYPEPRNTIVIYEAARYGASLVDSVTLVQLARNAGVTEDISVPASSSSIYTSTRGNTADFDRSYETNTRSFLLSGESDREGIQRAAGTRVTNLSNASYSSSTSNLLRDNALASSDTIIQSGYYGGDGNFTVTDTNRNE